MRSRPPTVVIRNRDSDQFSPQRAIYAAGWDVPLSTESVIAALGVPRVDANDPGAALLATTSGTARSTRAGAPARRRRENHRSNSIEVPLRLVRGRWSWAPPRRLVNGSANSSQSFPGTGG